MQPWIKSIIGDDQDTFLLGNRHPFGILKDRFEGRMDDNLLRSIHAKLNSIITNGSWFWPRSRSRVINEVKEGIPSSLVPNSAHKDSALWTLHPSGKLSLKLAWQGFRHPQPEVLWWKAV